MVELTRRTLLRGAAATFGAAQIALPHGAHAQGKGPETKVAHLGYSQLTDAAPLIVAKERGLFAKYGMRHVELLRQESWDATCENLALGSEVGGIDGAHLLTPLAYLVGMGKTMTGGDPTPLHILARLNTNGQAICVSKALMASGARLNSAPLKAVLAGTASNRVGMTSRGGTHDLWLRYWLAAGGINPDKDVETTVAPPLRMVADMGAGTMSAFCVGEQWPSQLVRQNLGYMACTTGEIWKDHPEKSLAMRADWVAKHPRAAVALTAAVIEAQQWADRVENSEELAAMLSKRAWLNVSRADIKPNLAGNIDYGEGREVERSPLRMKFWADAASYPFPSHDLWFLTEEIRWGILPPDTDTRAAVATVNRHDVWREAAALANVPAEEMPAGTSRGIETFFDGQVFDPNAQAEYLSKLRIKTMMA